MNKDSEKLRMQIADAYNTAVHFNNDALSFASVVLEIIGEDESRLTRTKRQNRARWKYLTEVANVLNDMGFTYEPPPPSLNLSLKWNKDLLYHIYWQMVKKEFYPDKKRQLNTKEFCDVANHVMDLFAMIFDIHIAFPNWADFQRELEAKNDLNK